MEGFNHLACDIRPRRGQPSCDVTRLHIDSFVEGWSRERTVEIDRFNGARSQRLLKGVPIDQCSRFRDDVIDTSAIQPCAVGPPGGGVRINAFGDRVAQRQDSGISSGGQQVVASGDRTAYLHSRGMPRQHVDAEDLAHPLDLAVGATPLPGQLSQRRPQVMINWQISDRLSPLAEVVPSYGALKH
ncbi:hypothetical protein GCM10029964_091740 [Kibdelosporangium lantanae]